MVVLFLLFSLSFRFIVEGHEKRSLPFDIQKDTGVSLNLQPIKILRHNALASCAAQCSQHTNCCSATYAMNNMSCSLYSCCFPPTMPAAKVKYLRKRPVETHFPTDCSELPLGSDSGVYTIYPTNTLQVDVYCDMRLECGTGWTVVQRRIDGTVDFNVLWEDYKTGFGIKSSEYWIGNDILNIMTNLKCYILRFDVEDSNGLTAYAEYNTFVVADETLQYKLTIGGYSGTAGDVTSSLNGMKFTTLDRDNDENWKNCADSKQGGWWFKSCTLANVNGLYQTPGTIRDNAIYWRKLSDKVALKSMSMKIKPL